MVLFSLLTACSTVSTKDIKVEAEADPKANLEGYHSYVWLGALNDPEKNGSLQALT